MREDSKDAAGAGPDEGQGPLAPPMEPAESPTTRAADGEIEIDAPPERVWQALTEAAELERWFPLEARVEPGVGGSIWMSWQNEFAGASEILVWEPGRHLRIVWGTWEGHGEGAPQVTDYLLEGRGGRTVLRVVTSGFPTDASWDEWVEGTRRGWRFELASLKHYLERHEGERRDIVYVRRRVGLPPADAWARLVGPGGFDLEALAGRAIDMAPAVQYAAIVDDPADALLRASIEPTGDPDARDATLWLSAWGGHTDRLAEIRAEWTRLLERLFPEGTTP